MHCLRPRLRLARWCHFMQSWVRLTGQENADVSGRSAETISWICRYLEQLPPTLFVTELLARSAVQMSKHYIVQCRLGFLTDRQLTKLQVIKQDFVKWTFSVITLNDYRLTELCGPCPSKSFSQQGMLSHDKPMITWTCCLLYPHGMSSASITTQNALRGKGDHWYRLGNCAMKLEHHNKLICKGLVQLLANSKLVAVCQLQHCKLTLVPYLEARSGQLRLMGFLIADDLGT